MEKLAQRLSETSLKWGLLAIFCLAVLYGLRAWRAYRGLEKEAAADFEYKKTEGMLPRGLGAESYVRAYRRFHAPRGAAFISLTLGSIAIFTVPAMGVFYGVTFFLWELGGKDKVFAPGLIVHSMLMFFLIISFWAHPQSLEAEIRKEMQ
jgi:hypothetical protein